MVSKFKARNPLIIEERRKILNGLENNLSYGKIALSIGRAKSVVIKEAKRLGDIRSYNPEKAQKDFISKQRLVGIKKGCALYLKIKEEEKL